MKLNFQIKLLNFLIQKLFLYLEQPPTVHDTHHHLFFFCFRVTQYEYNNFTCSSSDNDGSS